MKALVLALLLASCASPAKANMPYFPPDECAVNIPSERWSWTWRHEKPQRVDLSIFTPRDKFEYGPEHRLLDCNPRGRHTA